MLQFIVALGQSLLNELPREGYRSIVEQLANYHRSHRVHLAVTSFLATVAARQPDEAAGLCSPTLQETLRKDGGIAANFETLRTLLNGRAGFSHDAPGLTFSGSLCHQIGRAHV